MTDTVLRRHYMLTMRLDLSGADVEVMQSLAERLHDVDVVVSTLQQEQSVYSKAIREAYLCHNACRKKQPPVELRQEPLAFDRWITAFVEGGEAAPDLYFLAMQERETIGVCLFVPDAQQSDLVVSGFTGVLPAWEGRGIAKALKAHSLICVRQRGFRYVETSNLMVNRGMCSINRSLGFQIVRKHLHCYQLPVRPSEPS